MKHKRWTEEEKEIIRSTYVGNRASVLRIAHKVGHPPSSVIGQIQKLGLGNKSKHHPWSSEEEERLAELIPQYHITKVAKLLRRSVNSVAVRVQRIGLSRRVRDGYFTQKEVAQLLGVDSHWVHDRIIRGELKAKPINKYIPSNGGSRWRITEKDIKQFVIDNALSLTGRNVDISLLVYLMNSKG